MRTSLLYLTLAAWFLTAAACGGADPPEPTATAPGTAATPDTASAAAGPARILFLGDSIAAGYGLDDPDQAFPGLIQQRIDALGWDYEVVNAGVSGATTADGLQRIGWLLREPAAVVVVELGGNDGLRGVDLGVTRRNLQAIIDTTRARAPEAHIVLVGMQIPPNMGADYTRDFAALFPELAQANDVTLVPFLLEGVGGVARLNQPDGIHPTAEGQRIVADNVWSVLEPLLAADRLAAGSPAAEPDCALAPALAEAADCEPSATAADDGR